MCGILFFCIQIQICVQTNSRFCCCGRKQQKESFTAFPPPPLLIGLQYWPPAIVCLHCSAEGTLLINIDWVAQLTVSL